MGSITLTIPNDDHIALRAFGKALEEMALAHGAEPRKNVGLTTDTAEVDTTAQQVESLSNQREETEQIVTVLPRGLVEQEEASSAIDSTGAPWDERIHSTSKVFNADGTWRLRRKPKDMDEAEWAALIESVKGELRTQTPAMADEEVKTLESVEIGEPTREEVDDVEPPVTPPGDDFHTDAGIVTEQTVAGIPPVPPVPYVPAVPPLPPLPEVPVVTEWDFPRLMTFLTERHGKIDVATVNTLLAQDGMSSVQELNAHPDRIGPFVARVKAYLGE